MTERQRQLFFVLRGALIQALNVLDDLLGLPRTVPGRSERLRQR
jgi:hypothetical protein